MNSKKIVANLLKLRDGELAVKNSNLKDGIVLSLISKAKAKGYSSEDYSLSLTSQTPSLFPQAIHILVASIYNDYTKILRQNNSLDFDDLLCYGVKLFKENSKVVDWCQHVLVDEL
jgi:DNA helicase II / ATP-dependent DNA helicase PcrA